MLYDTPEEFARHNEEVKQVWDAFHKGKPTRVPMTLGISARTLLLDPKVNTRGTTFYDYFSNPEVMMEQQLYHAWWVRHNLPFDQEMGLPKDGWGVWVDFQNIYEQTYFGCPIHFRDGEVPDVVPILTEDRKNLLFDRGLPDPFRSGLMKRNWEYYHFFLRKREEGYIYQGRPIVSVSPCGMGTDGPFTAACGIRGAAEIAADIYLAPEFVHKLMAYITDATIARIQAYRKYLGHDMQTQGWGFADDSIQLLSVETYKEFVLPYHRKLVNTFSKGGPNSIHLCGDATRHFKTLRDELNIMSFDTGFPVDFGRLRKELGPKVHISGGVHVTLLRDGTPEAVRQESKRILQSGIKRGGKFVFREGNNLAPCTPIENLKAMYAACKEYGRYR